MKRRDQIRGNLKRKVKEVEVDEIQKGIRTMSKIIKNNPDHHIALMNRGNLYKSIGNNEKALADYDRAIEHNENCNLPRCGWVYLSRGFLKLEMGDYIGGVQDLQSAMENDPGLAAVCFKNSGKLPVADTKRLRTALKTLNKHVSKHPEDAETYAKRSVVFLNLADIENAIEDIRKMISLNPETETGHLYLGVCCIEAGWHSEAITNIRIASKVFPDKVSILMYLGIAYENKGSYGTAVKYFTQAIALKPDLVDAYVRRYSCLIRQQKHKLARKDKLMIEKLVA